MSNGMLSGGELIYQTSDEYGTIEVVDYINEIRALHFGNATQQSASLLCNPYFLIHKYTQAMMLPLCWLKPKRVLVLGLGAGSIVKYLYNYHPDIIIDALELRPKVIDIATEFFMLPSPNEHLNIYNDSVQNWLSSPRSPQHNYDLIIVDVFLTSTEGENITVDLSPTLNQIVSRLSESGVAVFNHLGNNTDTYPDFEHLSNLFKLPIHTLKIAESNVITLASQSEIPLTIPPRKFDDLAQISTLPYKLHFDLLQQIKM